MAGTVAEEVKWRYAGRPEQDGVDKVASRVYEVLDWMPKFPSDTQKELKSFLGGRDPMSNAEMVLDLGAEPSKVILQDNWPTVQAIAEALLEHHRVDGEELAGLLAGIKVREEP